MYGAEPGAECAGRVEQGSGGQAVVGQAGVVLGRLFRDVGVQRSVVFGGPSGRRGQAVDVDRPNRMDGGAEPHVGSVEGRARPVVDPIQPGIDRRVTVAALDPLGRPVAVGTEAAVLVQGVEQCDTEAGVGGRRRQRLAHGVGVGVGRAVGTVVEVVELADRRDARPHHLAVDRPGQAMIALGVEPLGHPVHDRAPGPERPLIGLGVPP